MSYSDKVNKVIVYAVLIFFAILAAGPFYLMIIMSTYSSNDLFKGIHVLPGNYLLENLITVFNVAKFHVFYFNSLYIAVCSTLLLLIVCAMCGYALAKYDFAFRKTAYTIVLLTMMVPIQLGLVAFVWEMKQIGWMNTHLPLIIPAAANGFAVFWMRQYMISGVPNEVIESARIDGCTEYGIFFRIVIHFIKPAIGAQALLSFMWSWNNYQLPLVIIYKQSLYTITQGLSTLDVMYRQNFGARITALAIGTIPLFIIFLCLSKSLISGLTSGAVKG